VADYAYDGGGGAAFVAGYAYFENTLFAYNSANYSANGGGGALYVSYYGIVTVGPGCSFVGNTANYQSGGAVFQYHSVSANYEKGTLFEFNSANDGAAIYVLKGSFYDLPFNQTYFRNNTVCNDVYKQSSNYSSAMLFDCCTYEGVIIYLTHE